MQHLFVPQELALKLKEKGFNEPCFAWIYTDVIDIGAPKLVHEKDFSPYILEEYQSTITNSEIDKTPYGDRIAARPLYQQVQDWFREKHFINIHADSLGLISYYGFVGKIGNYSNAKKLTVEGKLLTYYEALTKAIEEAIKLI